MNIWKKLRPKAQTDFIPFLEKREKYCVSAISRLGNGIMENIWASFDHNRAETTMSAMLMYGKKLLFPVFNFSSGQTAEYKKNGMPLPPFFSFIIKTDPLHAIQGLSDDLDIMEFTLSKKGIIPSSKYDYELRSLHYPVENSPEYSDEYIFDFEKCRFSGDKSDPVFWKKIPKGLVIRRANISDTDALFPLQAGYEKEEVLPKGAEFNPAACRRTLEFLIADNVILTAELNGILAGKININAQSWNCLQIGGVYVLPEYRSLGIARAMTTALLRCFAVQKKLFTLFVKKKNLPARRVYDSLGFKVIGEYRISYYI